jgi:hypothetical protein
MSCDGPVDCKCGSPHIPNACITRGNALNLALTGGSGRRGIIFDCSAEFGWLMGYRQKFCLAHADGQIGLRSLAKAKRGTATPKAEAALGKSLVADHTHHHQALSTVVKPAKVEARKLTEEQVQAVNNLSAAPVQPKGPTTITITFGSKVGHRHQTLITGDEAIHINGRVGATIYFKVGETYILDIGKSARGNAFIITDHPTGGPKVTTAFSTAVTDARLQMEIGVDFPRQLYYQSTLDEHVGGWIQTRGHSNDKTGQ